MRKSSASDLRDMSAVILCGGLGTRLREETEIKPKPMVCIGEQPILWHIMKLYRYYGVCHFILCLGYRGDVIRDYFLNYRLYHTDVAIDLETGKIEELQERNLEDWQVVLAETGTRSMTGARIRRSLNYVRGDQFFVTYGDGVANLDIGGLLKTHQEAGRMATVTAVHPSSRFGELALDGRRVSSFKEKPQLHEGWINGGFLVMEKQAFRNTTDDDALVLETDLLEDLAQRHELAVYRHEGFWQCMDTIREMQLLNELWQTGAAPWKVWEK